MPKLITIHTGDLHLTDLKPKARVDEEDWLGVQMEKLQWMKRLCEEHKVPLIVGGDVFDKTTLTFNFLNKLKGCFPEESYCLLGNHDEVGNNTQSYERSVWYTGYLMGLYTGIYDSEMRAFGGVTFGFIPATNTEEEFLEFADKVKSADVIVMHRFIFGEDSKVFNSELYKTHCISYYRELFSKSSVIIGSDNHRSIIDETARPYIYNCGMPIRDNADLVDYAPIVFFLYDNMTCVPVSVPIENDKITDRHIKREKQEKEKNKAFIRTLQEASDIRLSFVDNLRRRLTETPECYQFVKTQYNALKGKEVL